ncbi:M48 family metallopeptidase [Oceanimonas baumannii]|uniref:M48 family metallopeptidase n=1 Tax=Oceanimonas baumannii TaxID=129578 RepID=UPI001D182BEB|nr:M48 family metallopeptidase [Oceanimonas baumannii]MCC4264572.1 M48 family metallopeptidase [Oceanimonas baumannii]
MKKTMIAALVAVAGLSGCVSNDTSGLLGAGMTAFEGVTLSKAELQAEASLSAKQMDTENKLSAPNSRYSQRLARLTKKLTSIDGTPLNFAVYESDEINAFAMPDGTVRVYSGLMDVMDDNELMAVIGHEVGHVKFEHSLNQYKTAYLTEAAKQAAASTGGVLGSLASSQYGDIGAKFLNAQFSQQDELESDAYGVEVLCQLGMDPYGAMRAQEKLMKHAGNGGGLFSSHPATDTRIEKARKAAAESSCGS